MFDPETRLVVRSLMELNDRRKEDSEKEKKKKKEKELLHSAASFKLCQITIK